MIRPACRDSAAELVLALSSMMARQTKGDRTMNRRTSRFATAILLLLTFAAPVNAEEAKRITILYDAFGAKSALVKDWGFAAFVEYGGKRILFDTGNNAKIFEHNARQLRIDLKRLDAVVISHRHGDHT